MTGLTLLPFFLSAACWRSAVSRASDSTPITCSQDVTSWTAVSVDV